MMTITQPAAKFLLTSDPLAKGLFISQQINVIPCGPVFRLSQIPVRDFPLTGCNIHSLGVILVHTGAPAGLWSTSLYGQHCSHSEETGVMGEALVSWDVEIAENRMPRSPWSLPFPVWSWGSGCDPRSLPSILTVKGTP